MYDFIKNMWIMRKYAEINISNCVDKAYITQEQANTIMTMEQVTTTTTS
ncbi:hypothetical protein [Clostridium beijerinckii]|nr:hypothetical protein [Clostridium beijerinckii]